MILKGNGRERKFLSGLHLLKVTENVKIRHVSTMLVLVGKFTRSLCCSTLLGFKVMKKSQWSKRHGWQKGQKGRWVEGSLKNTSRNFIDDWMTASFFLCQGAHLVPCVTRGRSTKEHKFPRGFSLKCPLLLHLFRFHTNQSTLLLFWLINAFAMPFFPLLFKPW